MTLIENLSRFLTHAVINLLVDQLPVKSTSEQTANVSLISRPFFSLSRLFIYKPLISLEGGYFKEEEALTLTY